MIKGQVIFQAPFSGAEFEAFEINPPFPGIVQATLKSSPADGIVLTVDVSSQKDMKTVSSEIEDFTMHVAKMLTFKFNRFHRSFRQVRNTLIEERTQPDGSAISIAYFTGGSRSGGTFSGHTTLGFQQIAQVKSLLGQASPQQLVYYDLFYSALGQSDILARFMALYNVVLTLCGDRQETVDQAVLQIQPNIPTNSPYRPRSSGIPETVYTRLRNQIGHIRPGTTIESTRQEMETHLPGLIQVVRTKIEQHLALAVP